MSDNLLPIESISDTAFGIAIARAIESDRLDANFCDPLARMLGGDRGEKFILALGGPPDKAGLAVAIRTCLIDDAIAQSIRSDGVDTVLNLAAGLDTRPYRMSLPASLVWIEVDLPAIASYKQEKLASEKPICNLKIVPLDLTNLSLRNQLFAQVSAASNKVLIITEGLLAYLTSEQVGSLAIDLRRYVNFRWWVCELASPFLMQQVQKKWGKSFNAANAKLQFAPAEGSKFFAPYGWRTRQYSNFLQEAPRLNRDVPFGSLLRQKRLFKDGVVWLEQQN